MKKTSTCQPFLWEKPKQSRQFSLNAGQTVVDFNLIFTGVPEDIDHVLNALPDLPINREPVAVATLDLRAFLTEERCAVAPALSAFRPLQIRLYDFVEGEESETAVWQAIKKVYEQAAQENKIVFADPNFITGDPEGGSGSSGSVVGGPEGGSGSSGSVVGGPEGGSGSSGNVVGGPTGSLGNKTVDEAYLTHWAFYPAKGISLETGSGFRINQQNKGQNATVYIFDTVDKRIDAELDWLENHPARKKARHHVQLSRCYPPEPLELCISSPAERFIGTTHRRVLIESLNKTRIDEHGLFAAGIVHRIAPLCTIHLVDILNQYGQGELFGFLVALMKLAERGLTLLSAKNRKPLQNSVINLSLGVTLAEEKMEKVGILQALEKMREGVYATPTPQNPLLVSLLENMLTEFHHVGALRLVTKLLYELGAVIVAAAGNDSAKVPGDLPPQIPARYPEVISVAASVYNGKKANYSNRGDLMAPGGGSDFLDVILPQTALPTGASSDASETAIMSIVPKLKTEESGFALWRGTSFATPMVSGLIALMLEKMQTNEITLSPMQLKQRLNNRARDGVIDVQTALDSVLDQ